MVLDWFRFRCRKINKGMEVLLMILIVIIPSVTFFWGKGRFLVDALYNRGDEIRGATNYHYYRCNLYYLMIILKWCT